ncbi:hypothetical protein C8J56DRAFT_776855, partial [Mycena floridula]
FGVLKRRFRSMTVSPEYSKETQAKIPCALAALHNFISIHDPDDFADEGTATIDGPQNIHFTLRDIDGDERCQFPIEELGRSISSAKKERATAFWDQIAQQMWDAYILDQDEDVF